MARFRIVNDISWNSHRSGWKYVLSLLKSFETNDGILLDGFVDSTFGFSEHIFEKKRIIPYTQSWVGFVHHPLSIPGWYNADHLSIKSLIKNERFRESLPYCKGLFTFSKYLSQYLRNKLKISVRSFYHPTEFPQLTFDMNAFRKTNQIVQIGSWLRNMSTFYFVDTPGYKKIQLAGGNNLDHLRAELNRSEKKAPKLKDVLILPYLSNDQYDQLLSESIVFIDLFDSSVNNSVIECMVRNTPILVNKIPPVIEYLGAEYPLYYSDAKDIPELLKDKENIYRAWKYLSELKTRKKLTSAYFLDSILTLDMLQ